MEISPDWSAELAHRWDGGVVRYPDPAVEVLDPRFAKWESSPDNTREAKRILQIVRSYLARGEIQIGPSKGKSFD